MRLIWYNPYDHFQKLSLKTFFNENLSKDECYIKDEKKWDSFVVGWGKT